MTFTAKCRIALLVLLCTASQARAGTCAAEIDHTQIQLDRAIEQNAGAHGWKPESLSALRNHQPTPRSIAEAEGGSNGVDYVDALNALNRARTADHNGDTDACNRELAQARAILR